MTVNATNRGTNAGAGIAADRSVSSDAGTTTAAAATTTRRRGPSTTAVPGTISSPISTNLFVGICIEALSDRLQLDTRIRQ